MRIRLLNQKYTPGEIWKLKQGLLETCLAPKKLYNFIRVQWAYRTRRPEAGGVPYAVMVEPTSACNLSCHMCARTVYNLSDEDRYLPLDQFSRLLDEIGDQLMLLSLWNYGEPLLNPELPAMIRKARAKKIFVIVTTNGTLLKGRMAGEIMASGLNYLKISLDAVSEKGYRRFRPRGSFPDLCHNIESFCRLKKDQKTDHPFVDLTFLVMKDNEHEMDEARRLAAALGADRISFRKLDPHFAENPMDALPGKGKLRLSRYTDQPASKENLRPCSRVWTQAVINSDGRLFPCCLDLKLEHPLGALDNGASFRRIWRGKKYTGFRSAQIREPESYPICRNCHARNFSDEVYIDE